MVSSQDSNPRPVNRKSDAYTHSATTSLMVIYIIDCVTHESFRILFHAVGLPLEQVNSRKPVDCYDVKRSYGQPQSGVYTVYLGEAMTPQEVYCDMDNANHGWTVCINLYVV